MDGFQLAVTNTTYSDTWCKCDQGCFLEVWSNLFPSCICVFTILVVSRFVFCKWIIEIYEIYLRYATHNQFYREMFHIFRQKHDWSARLNCGQKSGKIIILVIICVILQGIFLNISVAGALLIYLRWELWGKGFMVDSSIHFMADSSIHFKVVPIKEHVALSI